MLRDSRCRLARGYGSPRISAAAQGAIQSNQIGGDSRLTLLRADLRLPKDRAVHPTPTENLRDLLCIARS